MSSSKSQSKLLKLAEDLQQQITLGEIPELEIPTRTRGNIEYDNNKRVWVYGDRTSKRSGKKVTGAQKLLKMAYTIEFLKRQLDDDKSSTLRELYYLSESWEHEIAHFNDQEESNELIEDLEIISDVNREEFHMHPEESGASLMGPLKIKEKTNRGERELHLQEDVGQSGYTVPNNPDSIEFLSHNLDFLIAVETGGMRDRLIENGFDNKYNALITHLKGQPARATRRIIRRINDELDVPVIVFCDGDPWSYRIFSAVSYGSIKSAHLSEELATPDARYLGIEPQDIVDYNLPSDPLSDRDKQALRNELKDPRFQSSYWQEQMELQLKIDKKAEQQSLAAQGLDFVTDTYLPEKMEDMGII